MPIFDEKTQRYFVGGVAALAAVAIVREFRTEFNGLGRPLAKAAIKSGLALGDKMREMVAQMGETIEDLTIEARYELEQQATATLPAHTPSTDPAPSGESNPRREVH